MWVNAKNADNPKVTDVHNEHKGHFSSNDVKVLRTTTVRLDYFPQGIEAHFPNLEGIFAFKTGIKSISKENLKPFPKLSCLVLRENKISELSSDIFEYNPKMKYLDFSKNKLKVIGRYTLSSLPNLCYAYFLNNVCVNGQAEDSTQIKQLIVKMASCHKDEPIGSVVKPIKGVNHSETSESANAVKCQESSVLSKQIAELKNNVQHKELTLQDCKSQAAQKSSESKNEAEKGATCQQRLDSAMERLAKIKEIVQRYEKSSKINSRSDFDSMIHSECLDALKQSLSDKKMFENENEILLKAQNKLNALELTCEVNSGLSCNAVNLNVQLETQILKTVRNIDRKDLNLEKITNLVVLNQHVQFLPLQIGDIFRNLEQLTISYSQLSRINSEAFNDLKKLKLLNVAYNKIKKVLARDLLNLNELEKLDLTGNQIVEIASELFMNTLKLTVIILRENKLNFIDADSFTSMNTLQMVDLSNNECIDLTITPASPSAISQALLNKCGKPLKLCCQFEPINDKQVSCSAADFNSSSPEAALNNVTSFDECIEDDSLIDARVSIRMSDVKDILKLEIIDQNVRYLPSNLGRFFCKIQNLIVIRSNLIALRKEDFFGLNTLIAIRMPENELKAFDRGVFDEVENVELLDFSKNDIANLPSKLFYKLTKLKFLDMSFNKLMQLQADIFPEQNFLENVYFVNNKLKTIETKLFRILVNVKVIDMSGNICIGEKFPDGITTLTQLENQVNQRC